MWCESQDGKQKAPIDFTGQNPWPNPVQFPICIVEDPTTLRTEYYRIRKKDGGYGSKESLGTGTSTFSEALTLALANGSNGMPSFRLRLAITIAAKSCERCMNVLAHAYGLSWGYSPHSKSAKICGTSCELCKRENRNKPNPNWTTPPCQDPPSKTSSPTCLCLDSVSSNCDCKGTSCASGAARRKRKSPRSATSAASKSGRKPASGGAAKSGTTP